MRTRTLLLLAIGCGLVILLAGGIQLLRVSGQQTTSTLLRTGEPGKAGDVTVELMSSSVEPTQLVAVVRIGGAADPDGLDSFKLVAPGKVVPVSSATCDGIAIEPVDCALTFTTSGLSGTARQLIFSRADEQLRWVLAQGA
jgi:hypothetical protein